MNRIKQFCCDAIQRNKEEEEFSSFEPALRYLFYVIRFEFFPVTITTQVRLFVVVVFRHLLPTLHSFLSVCFHIAFI